MKKILLFVTVFVLFASVMQAQTENTKVQTRFVACDTISNSMTKIFYQNLEDIQPFDSVAFSLYATGEIDLDSLDILGGVYVPSISYKGSNVSGLNVYESISKGATLTINNADSTTTYVQNILTVTKAQIKGYNRLKVSVIAASSGNDATDELQKYVLVEQIFKP